MGKYTIHNIALTVTKSYPYIIQRTLPNEARRANYSNLSLMLSCCHSTAPGPNPAAPTNFCRRQRLIPPPRWSTLPHPMHPFCPDPGRRPLCPDICPARSVCFCVFVLDPVVWMYGLCWILIWIFYKNFT
jgi:hypothetical protein